MTTYEIEGNTLTKTTDDYTCKYDFSSMESIVEKHRYRELTIENLYPDETYETFYLTPEDYITNLVNEKDTDELSELCYLYEQSGFHIDIHVFEE